ncbi:MAG TPA: L-2-hydroxyglutarate oxidase [Candidatus Limnocylindrales bacterium]|nr:L-2-hydroxyglutarate oxidase [Candidatus Limnocylindrales bacterium]
MTDNLDVAIVGGGIVGLATALRLLEARPDLRLGIIEQEPDLAVHQSGHNSGVVHAGLYYAPGSLKARLCREGKASLEAYCAIRGIPIEHTGKLVVALTDDELPRLEALHDRATANEVPGLELVGQDRIRELEPHAAGIRGLWSPSTGIVDFRRVALAYADDVRERGGTIWTSRRVTGLDERRSELVVRTIDGDVVTRSVISCAGLWADRVAALSGDAGPDAPRIVPFRGDYYTLTPDARPLVRGLIYPVPDPRFPFLGVHFTKRIDGAVWAGPNAVLAFARTGYRRRDLSIPDLAGTLTYPGFLRLARRYLRTGLAEMWRDWSKSAFVHELRRYLPELRTDQLVFGPSGVRAQALARDGTLVDDFDLAGSGRVLHVRNAPSPAATASLAIGRELAARAVERFAL